MQKSLYNFALTITSIIFAVMKASSNKIKTKSIKHPVALFFLLALGCMLVQFLAVEYHFNSIVDYNWLKTLRIGELTQLVVNNIGDGILLMTPFVALGAKSRKWIWLVLLLVMLWCLAQMLYMPSYRDLMPLSSFFLLGNVGDTVARSALGAFRLGDLEVLLPPVVLYIVYRIWLKRPLESTSFPPAKRLVLSLMCMLAFVVIRLGVSAVSYNNDKETASFNQQLTNDYCVMWTRQGDYVNKNGVVAYLVYGFVSSIYNQTTLTDDQKQQVTRFINEQAQNGDDYASARGKNVILLVVESLNSWVIGLDIDGREVAPTLNALCKDTENNLVTLNMRSQVKNGRSSDNSKGKEMCQSYTKEYKKGSVIMTVLDRTTFRKEQILLEIMPMPSLYILLNDLSSSSGFYIGHSMNMAERLNTYYTKPPHGFKWNKALVFVHSDDKPLFVDEAMRLEFLALNKARNIRKNSNRIINRKGAINLNYSEHTEFQTDRMFSDIRKIIDGDLKLNIFS